MGHGPLTRMTLQETGVEMPQNTYHQKGHRFSQHRCAVLKVRLANSTKTLANWPRSGLVVATWRLCSQSKSYGAELAIGLHLIQVRALHVMKVHK